MDKDKREIIELFYRNVKGKKPVVIGNARHSGRYGHWLEKQMGIPPNASNTPDIYGYEMKNDTTSGKTTFGDWSADYYIFRDSQDSSIDRDKFLTIFGKPNHKKNNRYSWSGEPCPKIGINNNFGQRLIVDDYENIKAMYSFSEDKRPNKEAIVPLGLQSNNLVLASWSRAWIKNKLEKKFNDNGWFKCKLNSQGVYDSIVFGGAINFHNWIELVKSGIVFFDSGMYQGNARNYSQWRANNSFWDSLINEVY